MVRHHYEVHPGKPPCPLRGCFARAKRAGRLGVVEPVFANICVQKRMHRFTLRSKLKVDVQWRLVCSGPQYRQDPGVWGVH